MAFVKLFSSIVDSTVWEEPDHTRIVWVTMLVMCDRDGIVNSSVPGLARRARVPIESVVKALETFSSPDEWSRTKEREGRRIEVVDGGWKLLNYEKYREKQTPDEVRAKTAERVARHRERKRAALLGSVTVTKVTKVTGGNPIAEGEAEAEADGEGKSISAPNGASPQPATAVRGRDMLFEQFWSIVWAKIGKGDAKKAWLKKITSKTMALQVIEAAKAQGPGLINHAAANAHSILHPATWLNGERWTDEEPVIETMDYATRVAKGLA